MRYYYTPTKMAKIWEAGSIKHWLEGSYIASDSVKWTVILENSFTDQYTSPLWLS